MAFSSHSEQLATLDGHDGSGRIAKSKFARAARVFVFPLLLFCTTTMLFCTTKASNFLVTHYFYGEIVVCAYPIFCFQCSCSLLFFPTAHFHLAGRYHFLFSHRRFEFPCFSSYEIGLLLFSITRSGSFSVVHVIVNIKNNAEKDTTLLSFFLLNKTLSCILVAIPVD